MRTVFDIECYKNYFLIAFMKGDKYKTVELYNGNYFLNAEPCDISKALRVVVNMLNYPLVGFNTAVYDLPMLDAFVHSYNNTELKALSDEIVVGEKRHWSNLEVDCVDLKNVAPGVMVSLKLYAARMHAPTLQELPYDPAAIITDDMRKNLVNYCKNDLHVTAMLQVRLQPQIDLRAKMGAHLLSKSDAQIAERVLRDACGVSGRVDYSGESTSFRWEPPGWCRFKTKPFVEVFELIKSLEFKVLWGVVKLPDEMKGLQVNGFRLGIGGLHSSESWRAVEGLISDFDVTSYYPNLMLNMNIKPKSFGDSFTPTYRKILEDRVAAKKAGDGVTADSLKIVLNGTFGKLGSPFSALYAPQDMLRVTIGGQMALLMLIERFQSIGLDVISANTDGITVRYEPQQRDIMLDAVARWEKHVGLNMEESQYKGVYSRDVNNYIAVTTAGKIKTKGVFEAAGLKKNPSMQIVYDAVVKQFAHGIDVSDTIAQCTDIRQFVIARTVKGGAEWRGGYLGKVVRWYYGIEGESIHYTSNGNKVAGSDGAVPCQVLPETMPPDLDYQRYIEEARKIYAGIVGGEAPDTKSSGGGRNNPQIELDFT